MSRESDGGTDVPPLENTAFFDIETADGYVRIDQSVGNQVLYTPDEARDVAEAILAAAGRRERRGLNPAGRSPVR